MRTTHTPEPWQILPGNENCICGVVISDSEGCHLATVQRGKHDAEANARLMVASPELLAALRRVVPWIGKMIADKAHMNSVAPLDCENALRQAEAVISKVEGK
jgi:hypothetical protein